MAEYSITSPNKEILFHAPTARAGKCLLSAVSFVLILIVVPPSIRAMEPADIYERWGGAVVTIKTVSGDRRGTGSGFIIPPGDQVVTNYHVIQGASTITVVLNTGESRAVQALLQRDPDRDLAILQIDPPKLKQVILGDSNRIRPGERVVAIGSPLGLSETVSVGNVGQIRTMNGVALIQITAPISPGNSGGPLFNEQGEVIGVNFLKLTRGENLNFAVAINELRVLLGQSVPRSSQHALSTSIERELSSPPPRVLAKRYDIHLWSGSVVSAETYRESGDMIIYERAGGSVTLSRASVARIVALDTGSVQEITRTPPPSPPGASPREKRVDVEEILAKRPTPPVPDRVTSFG